MKIAEFRVICDYRHNQFQIVTDVEAFRHLDCILPNTSALISKTYSITRIYREVGYRAMFHYE